ncbi:G-protein coupled receptor 4-like [Halichoeres trimaculatus]|uniref:G-protein coupled receptor 4-like n=1 Tax=Halichoeres trimaculatus TaxID=147232 RepID=UPI003D9DC4DE
MEDHNYTTIRFFYNDSFTVLKPELYTEFLTPNHPTLGFFHNNSFTELKPEDNIEFEMHFNVAMHVATCITISIGLPITLMTIFALYSLIRKDHVAPIYVINLLITDLFQFCCMIVFESAVFGIVDYIYHCLLLTSVGFMVCVSLERYLVIAHPLWYRFRRTIKISVAVCVVVWVIPPVFFFVVLPLVGPSVAQIIFSIFFIIPFPLFVFFLVGTLRALSASISVSSEEKRRIVGILVLVLLIYTLLFLPTIIFFLVKEAELYNLHFLSFMLFKLSPLADPFLYIFIRKDIVGKFLAASCWCKMESNDNNEPAINVDDM